MALREKYRHERNRRLRPDANDQYVEVRRRLRRYIDDPRVEPGFTRKPLTDAVNVVIVEAAPRPLGRGAPARVWVKDIHIIEKGGDSEAPLLESISRCTVRHRKLHLPAAAGRDRLHSQGKIQFWRRDPCACASDERDVRSVSVAEDYRHSARHWTLLLSAAPKSEADRRRTGVQPTCSRQRLAVVRLLPPPALRDSDPPAWIMYSQPRLCDLFKEIMAGLLQRPGSRRVRIRNDLDASHFSRFEAQEDG